MDKRKIILSKEELYQKYIVENLSRAECAHFFGVTERTLKRRIQEYGFKKDYNKIALNIQKTTFERYGVKHPSQSRQLAEKAKETMKEKFGVEYPMQSSKLVEKMQKTMQDKYGTYSYTKTKQYKEKAKETCRQKYGSDWYVQSKEYKQKSKNTCLKKYGCNTFMGTDKFKKMSIQTCKDKYGVPYSCMREECRKYSGNNSKPNLDFSSLLDLCNVSYSREFPLESYSYDFKVDNILFEINPSVFHNSTIAPIGSPKDKYYHFNKTNSARSHGYHCVHVFDWDDADKIVNLFVLPKCKVYARDCTLKCVSKANTIEFLQKYHLQGYAKDKIRLGLYYKDELVEIMTFGTPRYNKKYEYELIRLCSSKNVLGGAGKLFKHFVETYHPQSIISYCDLAKFDGDIYKKLGFELKNKPQPSKHWYNLKTKQHITDNLLRQKGFDKLFKTKYGKGTNNEELMKQYGFVELYDCGQATFVCNN